jgi:hypothetical protein
MNYRDGAVRAAMSLAGSVITLLLAWLVGQGLTYRWNVRQKRREVQLAVSQQFYSAYGEFFAVWKLWNRLSKDVGAFEERRWALHTRAAAAEATIEGILVKLSSELCLTSLEVKTLGRFRQGFQQLRQAVRTNEKLPWNDANHPEYAAFKELAAHVAALLAREWPRQMPTAIKASSQLLDITANEWEGAWCDRASLARI